jgi:hypothetical protein
MNCGEYGRGFAVGLGERVRVVWIGSGIGMLEMRL